jgi:glutamate formiminotransferase/formiminotetrahydrofolate cyclodeaminase
MNVKINAAGYADKDYVATILSQGNAIQEKAIALEKVIVALVEEKISK